MTSTAPAPGPPLIRIGGLVLFVALMGVSLAWVYFGMRAVMDLGGSCASGGPYVPAQQCPEGATALLTGGIPLLLLATFAATGLAAWIGAPTLLLPMWFLLFGSLGWNFLEYSVAGDVVVFGWLIPGIMFELMALPALLLWFGFSWLRSFVTDRPVTGSLLWKLVHLAVIAVGFWLGALTYNAWT